MNKGQGQGSTTFYFSSNKLERERSRRITAGKEMILDGKQGKKLSKATSTIRKKLNNANIDLVKVEDGVDGDARRGFQMAEFVNVKVCQNVESEDQIEEGREK
jgi:hypothetical protein